MDKEFEMHASLEAEMRVLASALKGKDASKHQEILRSAIGDRLGLKTGEKPTFSSGARSSLAPTPKTSSDGVGDSAILPAYAADMPEETRLRAEKLIDRLWHEGVTAAAQEAQKADPVVLDMFHDALTGKVYDEIKRRGWL